MRPSLSFAALRRFASAFAFLCVASLFAPPPVHAQVVTITPDNGGIVTITQGKVGYLYGTITNPSGVSVNISGENAGGPATLTYAKPAAFSGTSMPIAANSSYHGLLMSISAVDFSSKAAPVAAYSPFVQINTTNNSNYLSYTVNVVPAPEPSPLLPLLIGTLALGTLALRRYA